MVPPWFAHPLRGSASTSAADAGLRHCLRLCVQWQGSTTAMLRRYNGRARPRLLIPPCPVSLCRRHGNGWTFGRPLRGHVPRVSKVPALSLGRLSVASTPRVLIPVNAYINIAARHHLPLLSARLAHTSFVVNHTRPPAQGSVKVLFRGRPRMGECIRQIAVRAIAKVELNPILTNGLEGRMVGL